MDPLYKALSLFRRRKYEPCIEICTSLLDKNPYDEAVWLLKMRALTKLVYVNDLESEDLTDEFLDESTLATTPRPGTSFRHLNSRNESLLSRSGRPRSTTGRPISGIARPGTQMRLGSATTDRSQTSRPLTMCSARTIRLGTATMLSIKNGPFIQLPRLNIAKYASKKALAKSLFEYIFYHENNARVAMELATQVTQDKNNTDWWWHVQLAKCFITLNLIRNGEEQLKIALNMHESVEIIIRLVRIFIRLDQPLTAIQICKSGLEKFPNDVAILTELARLHEELGEIETAANRYREIVIQDAMNVEAIACIGLHHFYSDQPEMALRYYRRALQMGVYSAELYNNLGICCLYSQQLDLTIACFKRALALATDEVQIAEIWYNLSHLAITTGDVHLAKNCLNICLVHDPSHALALNNLAVIEHRLGHFGIARSYFSTALSLNKALIEPKINLEILSE